MSNALLQANVASPGTFSALADLFESMAAKPQGTGPAVLNPALVKAVLGRKYSEFRGSSQQVRTEQERALSYVGVGVGVAT